MEIGDSFKDQVINRCKCGRKIKLSINLAISSKIRSKTYFSEQGKKEEKMGKEWEICTGEKRRGNWRSHLWWPLFSLWKRGKGQEKNHKGYPEKMSEKQNNVYNPSWDGGRGSWHKPRAKGWLDGKGLKTIKNVFIKFIVTQNLYSFILPLSIYLFSTYYVPGTILSSKEGEEHKRGKVLLNLHSSIAKQTWTRTVKHKANSQKCYEGNPLIWNEMGGKEWNDEIPICWGYSPNDEELCQDLEEYAAF